MLEKHRYACFSNPSHSSTDVVDLDEESGSSFISRLFRKRLSKRKDLESEASEHTPTSEEFSDIQVVTRNASGNIVVVPIKVCSIRSLLNGYL